MTPPIFDASATASWYRNRGFWRPFFLRHLPFILVANLGWELAHLPLYTLWSEGTASWIAYSVIHCTLGDSLIAALSLFAAVILAGGGRFPRGRILPVAIATAFLGAGYTVFSEWVNTILRESWEYAPAMPIVPLLEVGLTPLLQWLVIPPLAVGFAYGPVAVSDD